MKKTILGYVEKEIELEDFTSLYCEYQEAIKAGTGTDTIELEKEGSKLLLNMDKPSVEHFIAGVLQWGGNTGNRIRGMLYKYQTKGEIFKRFKKTSDYLNKNDIYSSIWEITSLKGVGISYGSKFLRMMAPEQAAVYDSILSECFSYKEDCSGYLDFCLDGKKLTEKLKESKIKNPIREKGLWFVADIEAVVFYHIRNK